MRSSGVGRVLHNFHSINWLLNFDFLPTLKESRTSMLCFCFSLIDTIQRKSSMLRLRTR